MDANKQSASAPPKPATITPASSTSGDSSTIRRSAVKRQCLKPDIEKPIKRNTRTPSIKNASKLSWSSSASQNSSGQKSTGRVVAQSLSSNSSAGDRTLAVKTPQMSKGVLKPASHTAVSAPRPTVLTSGHAPSATQPAGPALQRTMSTSRSTVSTPKPPSSHSTVSSCRSTGSAMQPVAPASKPAVTSTRPPLSVSQTTPSATKPPVPISVPAASAAKPILPASKAAVPAPKPTVRPSQPLAPASTPAVPSSRPAGPVLQSTVSASKLTTPVQKSIGPILRSGASASRPVAPVAQPAAFTSPASRPVASAPQPTLPAPNPRVSITKPAVSAGPALEPAISSPRPTVSALPAEKPQPAPRKLSSSKTDVWEVPDSDDDSDSDCHIEKVQVSPQRRQLREKNAVPLNKPSSPVPRLRRKLWAQKHRLDESSEGSDSDCLIEKVQISPPRRQLSETKPASLDKTSSPALKRKLLAEESSEYEPDLDEPSDDSDCVIKAVRPSPLAKQQVPIVKTETPKRRKVSHDDGDCQIVGVSPLLQQGHAKTTETPRRSTGIQNSASRISVPSTPPSSRLPPQRQRGSSSRVKGDPDEVLVPSSAVSIPTKTISHIDLTDLVSSDASDYSNSENERAPTPVPEIANTVRTLMVRIKQEMCERAFLTTRGKLPATLPEDERSPSGALQHNISNTDSNHTVHINQEMCNRAFLPARGKSPSNLPDDEGLPSSPTMNIKANLGQRRSEPPGTLQAVDQPTTPKPKYPEPEAATEQSLPSRTQALANATPSNPVPSRTVAASTSSECESVPRPKTWPRTSMLRLSRDSVSERAVQPSIARLKARIAAGKAFPGVNARNGAYQWRSEWSEPQLRTNGQRTMSAELAKRGVHTAARTGNFWNNMMKEYSRLAGSPVPLFTMMKKAHEDFQEECGEERVKGVTVREEKEGANGIEALLNWGKGATDDESAGSSDEEEEGASQVLVGGFGTGSNQTPKQERPPVPGEKGTPKAKITEGLNSRVARSPSQIVPVSIGAIKHTPEATPDPVAQVAPSLTESRPLTASPITKAKAAWPASKTNACTREDLSPAKSQPLVVSPIAQVASPASESRARTCQTEEVLSPAVQSPTPVQLPSQVRVKPMTVAGTGGMEVPGSAMAIPPRLWEVTPADISGQAKSDLDSHGPPVRVEGLLSTRSTGSVVAEPASPGQVPAKAGDIVDIQPSAVGKEPVSENKASPLQAAPSRSSNIATRQPFQARGRQRSGILDAPRAAAILQDIEGARPSEERLRRMGRLLKKRRRQLERRMQRSVCRYATKGESTTDLFARRKLRQYLRDIGAGGER